MEFWQVIVLIINSKAIDLGNRVSTKLNKFEYLPVEICSLKCL